MKTVKDNYNIYQDSQPKNSKMILEQNLDDLSFTNAKSRLSISTTKKQIKNIRNKLFDVEEDDNNREHLNSGIFKFTNEMNKIV